MKILNLRLNKNRKKMVESLTEENIRLHKEIRRLHGELSRGPTDIRTLKSRHR